jgi:multiple sugar transport system permease protein
MAGLASQRKRNEFFWAMLFLAPNFLGFLIFVTVPVIFSLVMAFTNWDLAERGPFAFTGFENFAELLWGHESKDFWKFFITTLYFMLGIPVSIAGSLFLAVLLHEPLDFGPKRVRLLTAVILFVLSIVGMLLAVVSEHKSDAQSGGLLIAVISLTALVAVLINRVGLRTMFYLPFFTTGIAQFILWKIMLRPDSGVINATLQVIFDHAVIVCEYLHLDVFGIPQWLSGIEMPEWLTSTQNIFSLSPATGVPKAGNFGLGARDAIVMMGIWASVGGNNMLLYLAGLSNVPQDLYEAAMIDGAGRWKQFRHVSWPQLAPTTFFIVVMSCIGGLQGGFEQVQVMTVGRPADTTVTLAYYIYRAAFEEFRMGFASAISWLMFIIIFGITLINWKFGSRQLN